VKLDKLEKKACRRQAIEALAAARREPVYPVEFKSQFGEDALIWTLCAGQLDGFFIEVGAFDGYNYSATYALECVGWEGLLIEAIPERADECRARRTRSRVVHAALGAVHGGNATFTVTEDAHAGMFSYVAGIATQKKSVASTPSRIVSVPLTTMNELLGDRREAIDAAVIDVEGSELSLLAGFDLRKYRPKVLLIEDNSRGSDSTLADYMTGFPYTQIAWLKVNRVYVREDLAAVCAQRLAAHG
jgi:FkbM family methyltransferase